MNAEQPIPYIGFKTVCKEQPIAFPPQHQPVQPGLESLMKPVPITEDPAYRGSGKLEGKVAIVTGGDSGIGKAVAIAFAKEGADLVIPYLYETSDAEVTKARIEQHGQRCIPIKIDLRYKKIARLSSGKPLPSSAGWTCSLTIMASNMSSRVFWTLRRSSCTRPTRRIFSRSSL